MSGSSARGGFGGGKGFEAGMVGDGVRQAIEQLRAAFEQRGGTRVARGDVRAAVIALLAEKPLHGYQLIREIEERSAGAWKPSPGSVYPTLQLLTDEGLIEAVESDGRKTYSLTEAGRAVADAAADAPAPWAEQGMRDHHGAALPKAGIELAQAAGQVARTGTPRQVEEAVEVLAAARRKLHAILAQD